MSIINDALKKTQENLDKKPEGDNKDVSQIYDKLHKNQTDPKSPPPLPGAKETKPKVEKKSNTVASIFILLALIAALYFVYTFYYAKGNNKIDLGKFKMPKSKSSSTRHTPAPTPTRDFKPGELVLSGIFTTGDRRAALINDKIYEVGQEVNGNKIISIAVDKVEVMDIKGQVTILTTGR